MSDYQPINLSSWCNTGSRWLSQTQQVPIPDWPPDSGDFPIGEQTFQGLPFMIGSSGADQIFLGFGQGGYQESFKIPIHKPVRWVIFAHRLLESHILSGEPIGRVIAEYIFTFADGKQTAVPIRERFEIGSLPAEWGQWPFLAVSDTPSRLMHPHAGKWDEMGFRLTDIEMEWPRWFVLWAWHSSPLDTRLASITIKPFDRPFIIAGITISTLEEDPFGRDSRLPVIISLEKEQTNAPGDDLSIQIDRGTATYPYLLPGGSKENFLEDIFKGWGQQSNQDGTEYYVEIEARPSATLRVLQGQQEALCANWGTITQHGSAQFSGARVEIVNPGKNWVHVEVVDEDSGKSIPCRIHFRTVDGIPYQPHGHHNHLLSDKTTWNIDVGGDVRLGQAVYAYIDGKCQGWLPRGEVLVDISRGFEYQPLRTTVQIQPGQRSLQLSLKRQVNMAERRWFSGDTHVHFLSTMGALLEGSGEDLAVVNLLQAQWGHYFSNTEDFIGQPVTLPGKSTIVYTSQENRQHILGHLTLLGLQKPVTPWSSGGPDEAELGGALETTLSRWADACHAQGGSVVIPHFPIPNCENAALIATGRADAVEMCWHDMYFHYEYYRYLNGGYRLPLVAGTDKMSAEVPVGINRTYVHIPETEPFNYQNWCKYMRLGRTFITTGPMLSFSVEGVQIGDTLHLPGNGGTVQLEAEAECIFPIHSLEIVQEGRVIAQVEEPQGSKQLKLCVRQKIEKDTWLTARVGGPGYSHVIRHHDSNRRGVMAHTSPIYVAVGREWRMFNQETSQYILTLLEGGLEYIRTRSHQHIIGLTTNQHSQDDHQAYLEEPFHEAIHLLRNRMGQQRE